MQMTQLAQNLKQNLRKVQYKKSVINLEMQIMEKDITFGHPPPL